MKQQILAMIDKKIEIVAKSDDPYEMELPDYRNNPTLSLQELRDEVEKMEEETVSKKDALSFAYWHHN